MTKAVAINFSPKMDKGNTALILNPFLDGIREAGAEVELFYDRKLQINPCRGGLNCYRKTPGVCWQKDDMQMLYPKLGEADIQVFATPVYICGMPGPMKNLIDRTVALWEPFMVLQDGHCWQEMRQGVKFSKVVLVSSCAFWEMDNFALLVSYMSAISNFAGALLRPHADALKPMMDKGEPVDDIFEAARSAGRQLVRDGSMSAETLATVSREFMALDKYIEFYNQGFRKALDKLKK